MSSIFNQLKSRFSQTSGPVTLESENDALKTRLVRRQKLVSGIAKGLPYIRACLYIVGYVWMLLIPFGPLSKNTWVDENALQPNQATTYWGWNDVHAADTYLGQIEELYNRNASSIEKASYIRDELAKIGLKTDVQSYAVTSSVKDLSGVNAYGILPVPRASGAEAIVISASWVSRTNEGDGTPNKRGVALLLALARYLSGFSFWAKDLIFVVDDGYLDGMHAWLNAYHAIPEPNLQTDTLKYISGVIWTALCVDYPGHSFSHLGIFHEGLNGRLPNQDLLNSVVHITGSAGVPITLYDTIELNGGHWPRLPLLEDFFGTSVASYAYSASNVKRHVQFEALNRGSGVHGLFHKFRIDAITVFALPAMGPFGFFSLGHIAEGSLRVMNNMLERLHASFFFYILTTARTFVNFGGFLASAILVSVAMIFGGLRLWVIAGWEHVQVVREVSSETAGDKEKKWPTAIPEMVWRKRERPVLVVLGMMAATHVLGWLVLLIVTTSTFGNLLQSNYRITYNTLSTLIAATPLLSFTPPVRRLLQTSSPHPYHPKAIEPRAPLWLILKAFNLYISSIVISITAVLNFSLAAGLAVLLGVPLTLTKPLAPMRYLVLLGVTPKGLLYAVRWSLGEERLAALFARTIWEWQVLGAWFLPFACTVYLPLTLQALLVCAMPIE